MVNALIQLNENTNRVINIVKAKFGLKDKSEAINIITRQYEENLLEPELRPEFIEEMDKIERERPIHIGTIENFRKRYGLK